MAMSGDEPDTIKSVHNFCFHNFIILYVATYMYLPVHVCFSYPPACLAVSPLSKTVEGQAFPSVSAINISAVSAN